MSLETWKTEFYPIEAKDVPAEQAIAHSLQKWEGLLPENIKKHEVQSTGWKVFDSEKAESITIGAETCALCATFTTKDPRPYLDPAGNEDTTNCGDCPLMEYNDGIQCDHLNNGVTLYADGLKNPLIMITALKETLKANS